MKSGEADLVEALRRIYDVTHMPYRHCNVAAGMTVIRDIVDQALESYRKRAEEPEVHDAAR